MSKVLDSFMKLSCKKYEENKKLNSYHLLIRFGLEHDTRQIYIISKVFVKNNSKEVSKFKIGLTTKKGWQNFVTNYKEEYLKKYNEIKEYVNKQEREVYLHSASKINLKKLKKKIKKEEYYIEDNILSFNPPGFWFSCGTAWFDLMYKDFDFLNSKVEEVFTIDLRWNPFEVYQIFIDDLKIANINSCNKLKKFTKKYKDTNINRKRKLSLDEIKSQFDGIKICPYLAIRCIKFLKENLQEGLSDNESLSLLISYDDIYKAIFLDIISKEEKDLLWNINWETASGVIFNNINKIKYRKLN